MVEGMQRRQRTRGVNTEDRSGEYLVLSGPIRFLTGPACSSIQVALGVADQTGPRVPSVDQIECVEGRHRARGIDFEDDSVPIWRQTTKGRRAVEISLIIPDE